MYTTECSMETISMRQLYRLQFWQCKFPWDSFIDGSPPQFLQFLSGEKAKGSSPFAFSSPSFQNLYIVLDRSFYLVSTSLCISESMSQQLLSTSFYDKFSLNFLMKNINLEGFPLNFGVELVWNKNVLMLIWFSAF